MSVALVSMAMRVIPHSCASVPGLSSHLTSLLEGKIANLEATLRDIYSSQGIARVQGLEDTIAMLLDRITTISGYCAEVEKEHHDERAGLEASVQALYDENAALAQLSANKSTHIAWLQAQLLSAQKVIASQKSAAWHSAQELARARVSQRRAAGGDCGLSLPVARSSRSSSSTECPAYADDAGVGGTDAVDSTESSGGAKLLLLIAAAASLSMGPPAPPPRRGAASESRGEWGEEGVTAASTFSQLGSEAALSSLSGGVCTPEGTERPPPAGHWFDPPSAAQCVPKGAVSVRQAAAAQALAASEVLWL